MRQEKKQVCFLVPYKLFQSFFPFICGSPYCRKWSLRKNTYSKKDLDLIQCASKIRNLDDFLQRQRDSLVADAVAKATDICEEMGITTERISRRRKRMPGEEADGAGFTLEQELRREILDCLGSLSQEIHQVSANVDL